MINNLLEYAFGLILYILTKFGLNRSTISYSCFIFEIS